MEKRYDIIYAGELLPGMNPIDVRQSLGKLFQADNAMLDLLFSGNEQSIKRGCDEQLARRYKKGMEQAGARVIIRLSSATIQAAEAVPGAKQSEPTPAPPDKTSVADRVAALLGQPDTAPGESHPSTPAPETEGKPAPAQTGIGLAPPGTPMLKDAERNKTPPANVDTGDMALSAPGPLPAAPEIAAVSVKTDHLNVAPAGQNLAPPVSQTDHRIPKTDGISLAPEGTDFADCAALPVPSLDLDLHGLVLAEAGALLLETRYRETGDTALPDTSGISLSDPAI